MQRAANALALRRDRQAFTTAVITAESPLWLLGERFGEDNIDEVDQRMISITWHTYRKGFEPLSDGSVTDAGACVGIRRQTCA